MSLQVVSLSSAHQISLANEWQHFVCSTDETVQSRLQIDNRRKLDKYS